MGAVALSPGGFDLARYATSAGGQRHEMTLLVDGVHCGGCINKIERALLAVPQVQGARVNLSTGRLTVSWDGSADLAQSLGQTVTDLGFTVAPLDIQPTSGDTDDAQLLRCLAVAGFAAANVMLLSVAIWAGHGQGMNAATRDLLHWFSALIALPAVVYAGRPFFSSAWTALKARSTNMDVPISLAVLLACGLSLRETIIGAPHAYFDSAITLVFFLLIGRYLERRARGKARAAAQGLIAMGRHAVTLLAEDGTTQRVPASAVQPGQTLLVAAGDRIGADGIVTQGTSDIDTSLVTGESVPRSAGPGTEVFAGSTNGQGVLHVLANKAADQTVLCEIVRLMEVAERSKSAMILLADRVAQAYAPVVHIAALVTFVAWLIFGAAGWEPALRNAVAVLIITCPCALALAVPAVQVIASGALMRRGILLKSGTALERVRNVDTIVFDKTGTLTVGRPILLNPESYSLEDLHLAAAIAASSRHPLAQALAASVPGALSADDVIEHPGKGLECGPIRLGSADWIGIDGVDQDSMEIWLSEPGKAPVRFSFSDQLRRDAKQTIQALQNAGFQTVLLSGDRVQTANAIGHELGIGKILGNQRPDQKVAFIEHLKAEGRKPMMIGDGLNDAAALRSADVSLSPSGAAEISQNAADIVFQGDQLRPILQVLDVAKRADGLIKQNFAMALLYNVITVPLAMAGFVTPLIAALAMSSSSILVVLNALRLAAPHRVGESR